MSGNPRLPSGNGGDSPPRHRSREERARRFNSSLEAAALAVNEEEKQLEALEIRLQSNENVHSVLRKICILHPFGDGVARWRTVVKVFALTTGWTSPFAFAFGDELGTAERNALVENADGFAHQMSRLSHLQIL